MQKSSEKRVDPPVVVTPEDHPPAAHMAPAYHGTQSPYFADDADLDSPAQHSGMPAIVHAVS